MGADQQMLKEFYSKVLPTQGVYCVSTIDQETKRTKSKFVESIDDLVSAIKLRVDQNTNVFVGMSSFKDYSRKTPQYARSFFVDLDVGDNKGYQTKEEASQAIDDFAVQQELPPPTKVDSGGGIHAYWALDVDVPTEEWRSYASKFKDFCIKNGLRIDPVVTADAARIMRSPEAFNFKTDPPKPTKVLSEEVTVYSFDLFKEFLGDVEPSLESILQNAPKGMSEDQRKMMKLDNFQSSFKDIAIKSLEGKGCNQINHILTHAKTLEEPLWYAGLSIAQHCEDRATAIHMMSEEHPGYSADATERKAQQTQDKPYSCTKFNETNPGGCEGCLHRGKITNPLALGKKFKQEDHVEEHLQEVKLPTDGNKNLPTPNEFIGLPKDLYPFVRGKEGGIYIIPADDTPEEPKPPILVSKHDLYPIKRVYGLEEGECIVWRLVTPLDGIREFTLPMKHAYALDKFRDSLLEVGVFYSPTSSQGKYLMQYIYQWGDYLMHKNKAEIMRSQFGWTEKYNSFVIGDREVLKDGRIVNAPLSAYCSELQPHFEVTGSYDVWKEAVAKLNTPSLEMHAFTLLTSFGSPIMNLTPTPGVTLSLYGDSGAAKTGALYTALSVWANPDTLSVYEATQNSLIQRQLGLKNIPLGLDEVGDKDNAEIGRLIHSISSGKGKLRLQRSTNAERPHQLHASMIGIFTTNMSIYDKLSYIKKNPKGEVARVIEFTIKKPKALIDNPLLGEDIVEPVKYNFGHAGGDYIQYIIKLSKEYIKEKIGKWKRRFKEDFGNESEYRYYESLVSSSMAGGELAMEAGIINFDLDRIYSSIVGEMINIKDNVVKINEADYESILAEYINRNINGILSFKEDKLNQEPRGPLVIRAEIDDNKMYISKPDFRKFLFESQISTKEFLYNMKQKGINIEVKRKKLGAGWKDATGAVNVEAYVIPTIKFLDDIIKEDNERVA